MIPLDNATFNAAVLVNRNVFAERLGQVANHGYTIEHDDLHMNADFCRFIQERLDVIDDSSNPRARKRFIQIAAIASAAAERIDREQSAAADNEPVLEPDAADTPEGEEGAPAVDAGVSNPAEASAASDPSGAADLGGDA